MKFFSCVENLHSFVLKSSEHNGSLDDLDEEENHVPPPLDHQSHEELQDSPQVVRCGGEDGEPGREMSQRQGLNVDVPGSSSVRSGGGQSAESPRLLTTRVSQYVID